MGEWDKLRAQARKIEMALEDSVSAYSAVAQRISARPEHDEEAQLLGATHSEEETLSERIERNLTDLADCNERMSQCVAAGERSASSALLKRYREILFDYKSEFRKLSAQIQRKKERAELLGGAREAQNGADASIQHLYAEQRSINSSMQVAGGTLEQAQEARASLLRQRDTIGGSTSALRDIAANFPAVNRVIEAIQRRRMRENVVVGLTISFCICFTIYYLV